jgi:glycine hydroxymethyltransferase
MYSPIQAPGQYTAVYFAMLEPGRQDPGPDLAHGGHLTHGMFKNVSGRTYQAVSYQVEPDTCKLSIMIN